MSSAEAGSVTEVFAVLAAAAVGLFAFYKLGTVESVIKTIATVVIFIGGLYAAGFVFPSLQEAGWYQLIAWIVEVGPRLILEQLGGTKS
ncbi:MAG: hypothetical protein ABIJ47_10925 [Candidatus Bathyarchaeota archaeon]